MRVSSRARAGEGSGELRITPLIDCVFLLLTYFLFTISLSTIEGLLPSDLAMGEDEQQKELDLDEPKEEIVVRVVQSGQRVQYFIDDWPAADYASVSNHLGNLSKSAIVVLDAGANVAYEHVVRLYNRCLQLEIEKVVFPLNRGGATASGTPAAPRL